MKPTITAELRCPKGHTYQSQIVGPDGMRICANRFDIKTGDPFLAYVDRYLEDDARRAEENVEKGLIQRFGSHIYKQLAGKGGKLKDYLRLNPDLRGGFRFILSLDTGDGADPLWRIPWEYMHDGDDFLALSNKVSIVREPHGLGRIEWQAFPRPLRILVVISSPLDVVQLNTEVEIEAIQSAMDDARLKGWVEVRYLEIATLSNLDRKITDFDPHIIHYTGHGGKDPKTNESFLAFENDDWECNPVFGKNLNRILAHNTTLRLVVLSGCMTAQTSHADALSGVGTSLLKGNVPAILAMQYSIVDKSGIRFAEIFYESLAKGESIDQAVAKTRLALCDLRGEDHADWGLPVLYLRSPEICLINPNFPPIPLAGEETINIGDLPTVHGFVGRKKEIRQIRSAVRERHIEAAFIYGLGGIGKTALATKVIEKLGMEHEVSATFVVRCHKIDPTFAALVEKIANFISYQGRKDHVRASQILKDSSIPIDERVSLLNNIIKTEKYLFVFDNFESMFSQKQAALGKLADSELEKFFSAIFSHNWNSTFVFTSRFRWDLAEELPRENSLEIHLSGLSRAETIMHMNNRRQLRKLTHEQQKAVFPIVQGHPWAIELLNSYLNIQTIDTVLKSKSLQGMLIEEIGEYFMDAIWEELDLEDKDALSVLSTFRLGVSDAEAETLVGRAGPITKLKAYSLLQREGEVEKLVVHPVVREYVLEKATSERREELHSAAVNLYVRRYQPVLRKFVGEKPLEIDDEQATALYVLISELVNQGMHDEARSMVTDLLEIHHHLFEGREYEKAGHLVGALVSFLNMQGMREHAKDLLQKAIETQEGFGKYVAKGDLAGLLSREGKWQEALAICQECREYLKRTGAKAEQMAPIISIEALIHQLRGDYEKAIALEDEALAVAEKTGAIEVAAKSRYHITQLLFLMGKYEEALKKASMGLELAKRYGHKELEAAFLHQMGVTFKQLGRPKEAYQQYVESLKVAEEIGDLEGKADSFSEIGKMLTAVGRFKEALECLQQARDVHVKLGAVSKVAIDLEAIGIVFAMQGYQEEALIKFEEALNLERQHNMPPEEIARTERNIAIVKEEMKKGKRNRGNSR